MKLPLQRTAVDTEVERVEKEMSLLADQIKREEMEILALLEIMPERQTEVSRSLLFSTVSATVIF